MKIDFQKVDQESLVTELEGIVRQRKTSYFNRWYSIGSSASHWSQWIWVQFKWHNSTNPSGMDDIDELKDTSRDTPKKVSFYLFRSQATANEQRSSKYGRLFKNSAGNIDKKK